VKQEESSTQAQEGPDQTRGSNQAQRAKRLHLSPGEYGKRSGQARSSVGAFFGLAGMGALFFGVGLSVAAWLASNWWVGVWLHRCSVALLLLSIPLLAFGAHCFDCIDREKGGAANRKGRG
jgi:hypothetical protein